MEYLTFPMETMRITANYNDHSSHFTGSPKDYPFDSAGVDSRRSAFFATVDLKVMAIRGIGNAATNTIWLQTVNPVKTPTFEDYAWITVTHWNDTDEKIAQHPVGSIISKGDIVCFEGTDGVSANHLQIACGKGTSSDWVNNSAGAAVMVGDARKPEEVFYVNSAFTTVVDAKEIPFPPLPTMYGTPVGRNNAIRQVNVTTNVQEAFFSPGSSAVGMVNPGIYNLLQVSGEYVQIETNLWVKLVSGRVVIIEAATVPSTLGTILNSTIGSTIHITINKQMDHVSHTLRYVFGTNNVTLATEVDSSYQFTLEEDLYYHMLNSKSMPMTIYCDTYKNGSLIGTTSTSFTISAVDADVKPDVSITTSVDTKTIELTNDDNTIIAGITNLTYQLSSSLKYGASLNGYQIEDATGMKDVPASGVLEHVRLADSLKYRVVDSRGYNDWYTKPFSVVSYQPTSLNFNADRLNKNNMEEVTIDYSGTFDNKTFGTKEGALPNQLSVSLYYRATSETEWTKAVDLTPTITGNTYSQKTVLAMPFDKNMKFYFKLAVSDLLSNMETEDEVKDEQSLNFGFIYPIGRGFLDFTNTDYSNYLGFTWEKTLLGVFPVGCDPTQTEFDTLGKRGGSKYMQAHSHTFSGTTSQNGSHMHSTKAVEAYSQTNPSKTVLRPNGYAGDIDANSGNAAGNHAHTYSGTTLTAGSGFGENLPPYEVVNFWKRIA